MKIIIFIALLLYSSLCFASLDKCIGVKSQDECIAGLAEEPTLVEQIEFLVLLAELGIYFEEEAGEDD